MALVITNPTHVPPGGAFVAKCDQSGAVFRHHTMDGVWLKYNEHCRANGYPEVNERQITELICRDTKANICQDSDAPTFGQMLVNFAHDMYEWARAGFPASREVAEQRLTICQSCPYWRGLTGGSYASGACGKCGCSGLKLAIHSTRCPEGKWESVT